MTGRWLTVSATITRIWESTGHLLKAREVLALGQRSGPRGLVIEESHDHTRVLEQSVTEHVAWLQKRLVPRDPANPAEAVLTHSDNYDYDRERES